MAESSQDTKARLEKLANSILDQQANCQEMRIALINAEMALSGSVKAYQNQREKFMEEYDGPDNTAPSVLMEQPAGRYILIPS
jgi:hypothetical protein